MGYFRALEVTYDHREIITAEMFAFREKYYTDMGLRVGDKKPNYDTFHPHFHVLLAVPENYIKYWCPTCQDVEDRIEKDKRYKDKDTRKKAFEEDMENRRFVSGRKKLIANVYISPKIWLRLWKQSLKYTQTEHLIGDIRKVK